MSGITKAQHDTIDALERAMMTQPAVVCPLEHHFLPGLYIRTVTLPAGTIATSEEHKTRHAFALIKGSITIWGPDGPTMLTAPHSGITEPGTRRIVMAHEEVVWATFHITDNTDPEAIRKEITVQRDHLAGLVQPTREAFEAQTAKEGAPCLS